MAQSRTDELRELLERYPDLDRAETRRLRQLYQDATATDVLTILSSRELASKVKRLDSRRSLSWIMVAALAALAWAIHQYPAT